MKKVAIIVCTLLLSAASAFAQAKGVDHQSEQIENNAGTDRAAGVNGTTTNTGTGRGFDFGRGRTPARTLLPNPYRFTARRDQIIQAIETVMRDRKLVLDDAASRPSDGIFVSQPYTFIKGMVVTESELSHYAGVPDSSGRGWTRGRYTLTVEVQPIDGMNANVTVNAKVEGRTNGASGAEWVTLQSTGTAEQEFLSALIEALTGGAPQQTTP
ncbi:MAG TPA: hypothetical protein VK619_11170 [Pyrinomonadaceae bacterium]|nr:hypothetical protein [Pyrinomonadaceae bacterium]